MESSEPLKLLRQALEALFEAGGPGVFELVEREAVQTAYDCCHCNQVGTSGVASASGAALGACSVHARR